MGSFLKSRNFRLLYEFKGSRLSVNRELNEEAEAISVFDGSIKSPVNCY